MENVMNKYRGPAIAVMVAIVGLFLSAYVVPEEEQVVIIRTGNPVGTVNTPGGTLGPGFYLRVPFIDTVRRVEKRLLDLEMNDEEVLSNDQQRLLVNAYARFRITDPVRMVDVQAPPMVFVLRWSRSSTRPCVKNWAVGPSKPC